MLRPDDPYNQGIGTLDLGDMNLGNMNVGNVGQVPVNNMQQANWLNTISGGMMGTTSEQDAQNAALEEIQGLRNQEQQINALGEGAQYLKQDELKSIQKQIQEIKNQFKDVKSIQSASLKDEYADIEGQTASLINPVTKKMWDMLRMYNAAKKIKKHGPKVLKTIGTLTGGKAAAAAPTSHKEAKATGGDYHGGQKSTVDGKTTDWGPMSHMIARGGLAQYAPRGSYFNGGLASLWLR